MEFIWRVHLKYKLSTFNSHVYIFFWVIRQNEVCMKMESKLHCCALNAMTCMLSCYSDPHVHSPSLASLRDAQKTELLWSRAIHEKYIHGKRLTHLCLMEFTTLVNWTNLFRVLGVLGSKCQFQLNFKSTFCRRTVETLIRRRVLRRLVWVCTVCLCPTNRTLGLYGLRNSPGNARLNIRLNFPIIKLFQ